MVRSQEVNTFFISKIILIYTIENFDLYILEYKEFKMFCLGMVNGLLYKKNKKFN